jgi:predicted metal-dependent phosphoesterase TrpH
MTVPRTLGLVLLLSGIVAGTALDREPVREIPRAGGRFILSADFHVHASVGDGGVAPWELAREARRRELDAIVVTNHNQLLAARLAALRGPTPIVIVGQEVTAPQFHIVAAGIREVIDWRLSASEAIRAIHAQGGVAIAAHPVPRSWRANDPAAPGLLDGSEVAHSAAIRSSRARRELAEFFRGAAAGNPSLAPVGSSDFHFGGGLGQCRTYLFADEISEAGVLDAVRAGRTVAYDGHGRLTGDPERVRVVEALIARRAPPVRADQWARLASWVTLAGLAVLLAFK